MRLFLVRHAHRDTTNRSEDNGLSEKGREQAKGLVAVFKNKVNKDSEILLLSSPKTRCIETLTPFSKSMGLKITIDPNLDEAKPLESPAKFEKRLKSFLSFTEKLGEELGEKTKSKDLCIFACSHGDWLPLALHHLIGVSIDLKKAGCAEVQDGRLLTLLQPSDYI
jgi:broad specificity phosphatase PhoE